MATGGLIPQERVQYVTFYNTTGVIEKDKNIYFVPRFSKTGARAGNLLVSEWRNAFNSVCPPASYYTDIEIATWSPQDRTLRVKGNIDDFRVVTGIGACLNYVLLRRRIKYNNYFTDNFYAFFITDAKQIGGSSIELTVEPDYFTNVFYLHNNHVLNASDIENDYEPFNEKLKNCYVNRQHYNRVKYEPTPVYKTGITNISLTQGSSPLSPIPEEIIYTALEGEELTNASFIFNATQGTGSVSSSIRNNVLYAVGTGIPEGTTLEGTLEWTVQVGVTYDTLVPDNIKVFLNQEESFRYKYQFRDMKQPLSELDSAPANFTKEELEQIETENDYDNLSQDLRKKIMLSCIAYQVVELKSNEVTADLYIRFDNTSSWANIGKRMGGNEIEGYSKPNFTLFKPIMSIPLLFDKYKSKLELYDFYVEYTTLASVTHSQNIGKNGLLWTVNHNSIADYVYSAYLVSDVLYPDSNISIDFANKRVNFDAYFDEGSIGSTPVIQGLLTKMDGTNSGIYEQFLGTSASADRYIFDLVDTVLCFSMNNIAKKIININIVEELPDLKNNYYDLVLESEPYSFYSLSLLSYELTFNRNRYYTGLTNQLNVMYIPQYNGGLKLTLAPIYEVEGYQTIYYNEGLVTTITELFPLVSDSYTSYYYQNMSQMKNQFAVADYQWGSDFAQKFFVTSPNAVGITASKRGGWGALAETGNQVMGWVDDAIDLYQQKHVTEMNQQSKLADVGRKPDVVNQAGSEVYTDLITKEYKMYFNHYTIDELSYNSIAKMLERVGYQINLYDSIHAIDRVGWNFVKLNNFDFSGKMTMAEENAIKNIFMNGVTLLHDKTYLTSGHNYETILEGGN